MPSPIQRCQSIHSALQNSTDLTWSIKKETFEKPADYRGILLRIARDLHCDRSEGNDMMRPAASPGTAAYYRKTGKFPDGAVLVKEIYGNRSRGAKDGGRVLGFENRGVVCTDQRREEPLSKQSNLGRWMGWALFKADAPDKQVATDYKKDCLGCHIPAKSTDWTYVQGYPVLKSE